ncbi:hypothetical protein ESCOCK442M_19465 [Escherichia coli]
MNIRRNCAHASGVDKQFICRAALHHFSIASNDGNACRARGFCHAGHYGFQCLHRQSFFEDKATGEIARNSATDRNVIRSAANRQLADITARKEQRVNDVTVGGERQTVAFRYQLRQIKTCLIFLLCQPRVGKGFHKQAVD